MPYQWDEFNGSYADFERIVLSILKREHPDLKTRTRPGERGPDASLTNASGTTVFEIKFHRKMHSGFRRIIEMELEKASKGGADRFVLVAPVDPPPALLDWFLHISWRFELETQWLGQAWLDERLSAYPDIAQNIHLLTIANARLTEPAPLESSRLQTVDEVRAALSEGKAELLIGLRECSWLDVKEQAYILNNPAGVSELAKDAAAFANGDGGLLLVGYRTRADNGSEAIDQLRPIPESLASIDQHRKIVREKVVPHIRKLTVGWCETTPGKGVLVIDIPIQAERDKPFTVPNISTSGSFPAVAVPIRDGDGTHWLSRAEIQRLLSNGWNV